MKKLFTFMLSLVLLHVAMVGRSQIAQNYEVGTWSGFKSAAISYTFDDNCSNQIPVALPIFDQYKFKMTFFAVIDWSPDWNNLQKASNNGHEVASHTNTHPSSLATQGVSTQDGELAGSQNTINSKITGAKCLTIAYPNCNIGDLNTLKKYYISGRNCSGSINSSSPGDFFSISSIICGSTGSVKTAADFNSKVQSAKSSKGWCVFLIHGIDNDGGYSPTNSSEIKTHLAYMNTNTADYWVGTFRGVTQYIQERKAAALTETSINGDSLQFTLTDNLDNTNYNYPLTIRRALPTGWTSARVYSGTKLITSSIIDVSGKKFVQFDLAPDQGKSAIANPNKTVSATEEAVDMNALHVSPNPFSHETTIGMEGHFTYTISSADGRVIENGAAENNLHIGNSLESGTYIIRIRKDGKLYTKKIVKK